ncbi:hypothetical protein, partial [Gordonibacter pamelaeae]|uniref:hypothetical protein n=1 Tax=Gordonibacter pamelaeae TaxID=471189 RepID=UPI0026665F5F
QYILKNEYYQLGTYKSRIRKTGGQCERWRRGAVSDALDGSPNIKAADRNTERMFHVKHPFGGCACVHDFFICLAMGFAEGWV